MDYFSHGLWSYIFFHWIKKPWLAIFFGLLPDNLSWTIYLIYNVITGTFPYSPPHLTTIPEWVFTLYGISHSLIVCGIVLLIIYLIFKSIPVYIYAWPIAIVMDIFTHTRDFLPTPFLWPFKWYFPGINWGTKWFMIINYSLIVIFMIYVVVKQMKTKKKFKKTKKT